jgi:hypothetical protein
MKVFVVLFLIVLPTRLFAQQGRDSPSAESQPKAHFVTSGEWPLKWIGQTFTTEDQLKEVVLRNVGRQTISGFQLGWAVFIPDGCGVTETGVPRREIHLGPYEERKVGPGETVTVGPYHLSSDLITALARHAHSPAVVAQVGLYRVRYSDGGTTETISTLEQVGSFGAEPSRYPCQSNKILDADVLHTFTSPDDAFSFKYSGLLVRCMERKTQAGSWEPADSCEAYFPVCDDPNSQRSRTLVCFAYPRDRFEDAGTFEAATFSVAEIKETITEKECLSGSADWDDDERRSGGNETINGVKFKTFEVGEAGMNQGVDGRVYRSFHGNKCYELSIRVATANSGAFDPGTTVEFTKEDENEVQGRLKQALDSFTFLQ